MAMMIMMMINRTDKHWSDHSRLEFAARRLLDGRGRASEYFCI